MVKSDRRSDTELARYCKLLRERATAANATYYSAGIVRSDIPVFSHAPPDAHRENFFRLRVARQVGLSGID